jgi:Ca-activated chloride channel homolog
MVRSTIALQAVCCLFAGTVLAQDTAVSTPLRETHRRDSTTSIRVNSDLVLVPVLVTDSRDRVITDMARRDFRIYDNAVEQEISHFAQDDAPISVVLLFDSSGSMRNKLSESRIAVAEFLNASNPEDEFALIEFNDKPHILAHFTREPADIEAQLALVAPWGRTALLDGVCLALSEMKRARNTRKAILILSDGGDNHSRYREREVKAWVREADAQIYSIGILDRGSRWNSPEETDGPVLLNAIAEQSGGRYFEADGPDGLPAIAARIGSDLRNQYVIGFAPSGSEHNGGYHRITLKLEQPKGLPKLRATFRSGYLAPGQ